eukprot:s2152_g15.t1
MSRSCAVCGIGDSVKLCGGCKDRCYCSAECQRADWKTHKKSCKNICPKADVLGKSFDLFDPAEMFAEQHLCQFVPLIAGKGAGVVAKTFIPAGEIIVQDQPLMYINEKELGVSDIWSSPATAKVDRKHALVKEKFQQLSEKDQAKVLSLEDSQTNNKLARAIVDRGYADGSIKSPWEKLYTLSSVPSTSIPEIQDPGYKSAEGVFQTNCLPVGKSNSLGLFPLISRFNHSCCPNAGYRGHPENEEVQVVQAMRDIQPGEEQAEGYEEDSWCLGCSGLETLQTELNAPWQLPAFREAAHDVVVSAVRSVKALRRLASSCYSADRSRAAVEDALSKGPAGSSKQPKSPEKAKGTLPPPPPPPSVKNQEESSEGESEEEESREEDQEHTVGASAKSDPARKPAEPDRPPRKDREEREPLPRSSGRDQQHRDHRHHREGGHDSTRGEQKKKKKRKREDRSRGNRAGKNHQRVYRQLEDPGLAVTEGDMSAVDGLQYDLDDKKEWDAMVLTRGEIIEVHLPSTNLSCEEDLWAAFWVKQVIMLGTGDYAAIVKSVGCSNPDWSKYLSNNFNRKVGRLHFCNERPCVVTEDFAMHVTKLRVYSVEAFDRPYITTHIRRQLKNWENDDPEEVEPDELDVSGIPRRDINPGVEETPPAGGPGWFRSDEEKDVKLGGPREKEKEKREKVTEDEKAKLRRRLEEARSKMLGGVPGAGAGLGTDAAPPDAAGLLRTPSLGYSPSAGREETAEELERAALEDSKKEKQKREDRAKKEEKKKKEKETLKDAKKKKKRSSSEEAVKKRNVKGLLGDSKDTTMKSFQDQLLQKAAQTALAKQEKARKEKKKHQSKNPGLQLARILTKMTKGSGDPPKKGREESDGEESSKEKKKKKKKKRKRGYHGGDPSSPGDSSGSGSSEGGSSDILGDEGSSSSEGKRLEAPLKRKSKQRPGSVLTMLLDHARSKLDQSAKVTVEAAENSSITQGVKMSSYFSIIVRPQVGNAMAQARELHHLSQVIDLLRQGDLDVLGDVLASRFISLHQSVIDGSWATARHLEMLPLEEGSAAGPEVILNARKQARLAAKLAPGDAWNWASSQKGRGGRGRGGAWPETNQESKGKGKKGGKGKGKSKQWQAAEKELDGKTREKADAAGSSNDRITVELGTADFKDAILKCHSFKLVGVVLAWWLIAGDSACLLDEVVQEFMKPWTTLIAKHKSAPSRGRGVTFPLRRGELQDLVDVFATLPLACVAVEQMANLWGCKAWAYITMGALNRLAGFNARLLPGRWSAPELSVFRSVLSAADRRCGGIAADLVLSEEAWQKEMSSKNIGYCGEEVSTCHQLTWEQVLPALPPEEHGGCINCLDWVSPRTREFLENPSWLIKNEDDIVLPRMPGRVHIKESDKMRIANELVRRHVCTWIPLNKVFSVKGVRVLNGLFGVPKPASLGDGRPVLRVIMNLTGSNSTQLQMEGGCASLPAITSWQSIILESEEELSLHQSDMCSAFYLFRVPSSWHRHLAFNILANGSLIGGDGDQTYALACAVIPMGWSNSVGIMQEMSEKLLAVGGLSLEHRLARGYAIPPWMNAILDHAKQEDKCWWHVYLDNYAGGERVLPNEGGLSAKMCHEAAEEAWSSAGVVSSSKKKVSCAKRITELGAEVDGERATLGVSTEKLHKIILGTLWMVSQKFLNRKVVQVMAGRWVFVLQFRRPAMSCLQRTWEFISGKSRVGPELRMAVKAEFMSLIFLAPTLHCNLAAPICPHIVCTDASERGGSVETSKALTEIGCDFVQASEKLEFSRDKLVAPILIVSLYNGIGGSFRSYDLAGITPRARIAVDLDDAANRITLRRWPGTLIIKDVRSIDRDTIRQWSLKFLDIEEVHLWAGWPCVDLSSVKYGRQNLLGPESKLFWEIPRIRKLIEEEFGSQVTVKHVLENVASMDESAACEISNEMGTIPCKFDSADAVPMRRPRFVWTSETIEGSMVDISVSNKRYWKEVSAQAEYPTTDQWLTEGYTWWGESQGAIFPTCLKSIPRQKPPPKPAGLEKTDEAARERWRAEALQKFFRKEHLHTRICVSYFNGYFMTSDMRQKRTMMGCGFQCQCEACQPAGLTEVQELVRSADDGNMSDADMAALIGPDKMALLEWKIESNQRRQRLNELNTRLNTASSLAMVTRIVEEMDSLYRKEKILPHLLVEVQIALDLLQAHVGFGGQEVKKWCKTLYKAKHLLAGEKDPKTKKVKEWLSRSPCIMEVIDFANSPD